MENQILAGIAIIAIIVIIIIYISYSSLTQSPVAISAQAGPPINPATLFTFTPNTDQAGDLTKASGGGGVSTSLAGAYTWALANPTCIGFTFIGTPASGTAWYKGTFSSSYPMNNGTAITATGLYLRIYKN